jgi:glyoxylase-like metal-dependent hydrolase (beta-lactamase superfamily II)
MEIKIDRAFKDGDLLPGGMKAIHIPDAKSPGESPLFLDRGKGILILGDALIGKPPGRLNLMPPEKYKDPSKAREGIRVLLNHTFDAILVGDGASILTGGRRAIEEFLKS